MDWKDDLCSYFGSKSIYRLEFLKKELEIWSKEWVKYLQGFDGIIAEQGDKLIHMEDNSHKPNEFPNPRTFTCHFIKVAMRGDDWQPFQAEIAYFANDSGRLCLYLRNTETVNPKTILNGRPFDREENYVWTPRDRQEIYDDQIYEKDYVLQLLNNRLKKFFDSKNS